MNIAKEQIASSWGWMQSSILGHVINIDFII